MLISCIWLPARCASVALVALVAFAAVVGGPSEARACLWDRDTVAMEAQTFPEVLQVMTGKFPRHSVEFYQWREATVKLKLATDMTNLALLDDFAVSVHKQGRHQEAIGIAKASLTVAPRRYETFSNLGTFAIYAGDLPASREWLRQALEINPNAHFGRERYQLWLVEQLMVKRDPAALPELTAGFSEETIKILGNDYARFLQLRVNQQEGWVYAKTLRELTEGERQKAVAGVLGMMRFADFDNPILQAALADLLVLSSLKERAPNLAGMAYEHALMKTRDPIEQLALQTRELRAVLKLGSQDARIKLTADLDKSLKVGRALAAKIRTDEIVWIREKKDVDAEFAKKYLNDAKPELAGP